MPAVTESPARFVIIGRSSSHFTRVARLFAAELRVDCSFRVVRDLMSCGPAHYGGNPALSVPVLEAPNGLWFGALNICRELSRQSTVALRIVWPEHLEPPLLANAQELVLVAMATEVTLIMAQLESASEAEDRQQKPRKRLLNIMSWLEANSRQALAMLPPERDLSYLEVTLFCLVTHLEFRGILPTVSYSELNRFCQRFAARASAEETAYRFDA